MFEFFENMQSIMLNVIILFSLGSIYILLPFKKGRNPIWILVLSGLFVSGVGYIIMTNQFLITSGFFLDTRSVLISVTTAFLGVIPGSIVTISASIHRITQGGSGALTGVIVILATFVSGLVFRKYRVSKLKFNNPKSYMEIYFFGVVTHLVMLLCFYTLPFDVANSVLGIITIPVLLLFPVATLLLGFILLRQRENIENSDKIAYVSEHDYLTNLYNRHYFEKSIIQLNIPSNYPLSIIMGDVNGLKIINDSYGHLQGDKLLQIIANILRSSNEDKGNTIVRWGGDEFIVIAPNTTLEEANKIVEDIQRRCKEHLVEGMIPSISLGVSSMTEHKSNIDDVLKEAEELMYQNKLSEGKSVRSTFISVLENTLVERKYEAEHHSSNMAQLGERFAKKIGCTPKEIENVIVIAKLHDIGKIGISEKILLKNGRLNEAEYEQVKKHSEIGYRILSSIHELEHIAEYVLHHHERWDGTGYPEGLSGNDIPKLSRLISICDAYDVMRSGRLYQEPKSKQEAINDLLSNKEKQFDPELVDSFIKLLQE